MLPSVLLNVFGRTAPAPERPAHLAELGLSDAAASESASHRPVSSGPALRPKNLQTAKNLYTAADVPFVVELLTASTPHSTSCTSHVCGSQWVDMRKMIHRQELHAEASTWCKRCACLDLDSPSPPPPTMRFRPRPKPLSFRPAFSAVLPDSPLGVGGCRPIAC